MTCDVTITLLYMQYVSKRIKRGCGTGFILKEEKDPSFKINIL